MFVRPARRRFSSSLRATRWLAVPAALSVVLCCLPLLALAGCSGDDGAADAAVDTRDGAGARTAAGGLALDDLTLPPGFHLTVFTTEVETPRMMAWSPGGTLYVTETVHGRVVALPDRDGDGVADERVVWAEGLDFPHGLAFHQDWLYVAETGRVVRFPFREGGVADDPEVIIGDLPPRGQHSTRTIVFGVDGQLYVSTGSSCNVCEEGDPRRAAVVRTTPEGDDAGLFATGLRNSVGLAVHPATGEIWATDNGRDWLGDDLPPEEINVLQEGAFYGWPYAYGDRVPDPQFGSVAPDKVAASVPPVATLQAHTAPLGLTFYSGDSFPEAYLGDLFVAQHGSWNRSTPVGYRVVRIDMLGLEDPSPQSVTPFLSGFLQPEGAWGRPVDVAVGPGDGALYVSDERASAVYRVVHRASDEAP